MPNEYGSAWIQIWIRNTGWCVLFFSVISVTVPWGCFFKCRWCLRRPFVWACGSTSGVPGRWTRSQSWTRKWCGPSRSVFPVSKLIILRAPELWVGCFQIRLDRILKLVTGGVLLRTYTSIIHSWAFTECTVIGDIGPRLMTEWRWRTKVTK